MKKNSLILSILIITAMGCKKKECEYSKAVYYSRSVNVLPVNFKTDEIEGYEVYTFKGTGDLRDTVSHYISAGITDSLFNLNDSIVILRKLVPDSIAGFTNMPVLYVRAGYDYMLRFPKVNKTYYITGAKGGNPYHTWKEPCTNTRSPGYWQASVAYPEDIHLDGVPVRVYHYEYGTMFGDSYHINIYK